MKITQVLGGFHALVPCKVNLALNVLGRRSDGFHELETVMMAVGLCDELTFRPDSSGAFRLQVDFEDCAQLTPDDPAWDVPSDSRNLVVKAFTAIALELGDSNLGGEILLRKSIPSMAGLGGGSADAAAAILLGALGSVGKGFLWDKHFSVCQRIAAKLGSDVNFFLEGHTALDSWVAYCQGRGEKITPIDASPDCWLVLVHPPVGCSTKEVFCRLQIAEKGQRRVVDVIESLQTNHIERVAAAMFNDLESPASQVTPFIERSRNWIDRYDHLGQCMSGSGSARFCLCDSHEQAEKIANGVRLNGARAYAVRPWIQPSLHSQLSALWLSEA
ncbi:MAG: 4-(cytidine 5'-diphospho)-2-C-methyl-D-erythritol kinase [Pirellula sp.]|jgi:4-diphosphocytidyl-2-C-methyl-D-erythritol kinase|nr:4-(cytidine 5'-diphospho)-2-C-methyl-D-erythritol kinase [Pirellula sp.]